MSMLTAATCSCGQRMAAIRMTGTFECPHCDRACADHRTCEACRRLNAAGRS